MSERSRSAERLHWADTAKAVAVVLVVVYHVALTALSHLAPGGAYADQLWGVASTWLLPVRMPLFFLVSGVLAVGALQRPWRLVLRPRVLDHWWTFALWTAGIAALYAYAYAPHVFAEFLVRALSWTITFGGFYWYLPLLMLFFITARLLRRVPWLVVALAVGLYVIAPDINRSIGGPIANDAQLLLIRYCQFLVWFIVGVHARALVVRAARIPVAVALFLAVAYVPLARFQYVDGHKLSLLLSLVGITAVLGLSTWASRYRVVRRLGRYLAERTLPIYLFHPFILTVLAILVPALPALRTRHTLLLVPLLVVGLVALSCVIHDRTRDRLPWLYGAPRSPRSRLGTTKT